jgi:hypothetical protein
MYREGRFSPETLGREEHFKRAAKIFWNKDSENFIWHPWAEDMIHSCLCGATSGGGIPWEDSLYIIRKSSLDTPKHVNKYSWCTGKNGVKVF